MLKIDSASWKNYFSPATGILFLLVLSSCQSLPTESVKDSQQFNACSQVKEKLPDMKKGLDYAEKIIQPWIDDAGNKIEEQVGMQPGEVIKRSEKLVEEVPPLIKSLLNKAGITITFHPTDIPIKFTSDCEVKLHLTRTVDVPGGYLLIRYGN